MFKRIIIGVAAYAIPDVQHAGWNYYGNREQDLQAIRQAGGVPLLIPPAAEEDLADVLAGLDGLYLAGGGDIDASFLGITSNDLMRNIDPVRDRMEFSLARLAYRHNLPCLGVCRGCQVMAAALGGSLVLDIPSKIKGAITHNPPEGEDFISHALQLVPGSRLAVIYERETLRVNSYHHQAVGRPGERLRAAAHAPDGVIEAIEAPDQTFYMGVQWHPERTVGNDADTARIFDAFIKAAQARQAAS